MTKPILTVTEQAELLSQGNLYMKMPDKFLKRKDELGRLARSFDSMILNLKTITQQISDTSSQVAASSQELYASGEQVGKAAENVGNKIMEMATGAEEQSAQIDSTLISLKNLMEQIDEGNVKTDNMEKTTTEMMKIFPEEVNQQRNRLLKLII